MCILSFLALAGGFLKTIEPEILPMYFLHQMASRKRHLVRYLVLPPSLLPSATALGSSFEHRATLLNNHIPLPLLCLNT